MFPIDRCRNRTKNHRRNSYGFRTAENRDVDLIEEVLRGYGIDKIPGRTRGRFMATSAADRSHDLETIVLRQRLAGSGFSEVRTSNLICGLLDVLERNIRAGAESVSFFEIGRVFPPSEDEERHLGILLWGNIGSASNWRSQTRRNLDLFDLKGTLEGIVPNLSYGPTKCPDFALAI